MKVREFDRPSNSFRICYYLSTSKKARNFNLQKILSNTSHGTILFDDRIIDLRSLLATLESKAQLNCIEMVYIDRAEALRERVERQETACSEAGILDRFWLEFSAVIPLSFPKIPSVRDWHRKAESSHHLDDDCDPALALAVRC